MPPSPAALCRPSCTLPGCPRPAAERKSAAGPRAGPVLKGQALAAKALEIESSRRLYQQQPPLTAEEQRKQRLVGAGVGTFPIFYLIY